jgi:GntR family transcriptional regulator
MTKLISLDPSSPVALYLQICEQVRRWVALGALKPGDRLPTVRELAAGTRVNRNTAARAIQQLEADGIVRTRVGQGTFVADGAPRASKERRDRAVDDAIDRLLVESITLGVPLEALRARLDGRIERFERERDPGGERGKHE